jgi:putative membrane protein
MDRISSSPKEKEMKYLQGAAIAGGIMAAGVAFAQTAPQPAPPAGGNASKLSASDQKFVDGAAVGGLYEVETGRLAEKSANAQVRQFGARMVHDHSAANAKLKQIVTAEGGTLPQQLDQEHQQDLDHLRSLHGAEFAQSYMQDMVKDHDTDAQDFGKAAQSLDDPKLKTFAQQTLPMIETHDKLAHQISDKMASK